MGHYICLSICTNIVTFYSPLVSQYALQYPCCLAITRNRLKKNGSYQSGQWLCIDLHVCKEIIILCLENCFTQSLYYWLGALSSGSLQRSGAKRSLARGLFTFTQTYIRKFTIKLYCLFFLAYLSIIIILLQL